MLTHLFIILLLAISATNVFAQEKPKSQELGFARHFAEDYLNERGTENYRLQLELEEYTDRLLFFNDMRNSVFLLMARDEYAGLLNNQVLAFSIGVPHSKARETETFMHLYHYYDELIKDMAEDKVPREQKADEVKLRIQPMLFNIRWQQFLMDDVFEGQTEPVLSGCGAVAVGQLMKYYEWPKTVTGNFCYKDTKGNLRSVTMDNTPIDWSKIDNIYRYNNAQSKSLEPLMKRVSPALKVDFGNKTTTNWSRYMKRAMVMNFGYSPGMFLVNREFVDEATMINLIREELKAGGPSILAGGHHQFVCDGAYDDFLHLNMGWGGSYDGWYRFPVVRKEINMKAFIETALLNIIPQESPGIRKTIVVEKPGTLSSLLTEEECPRISALKVAGRINGADIRLLRRMAGALEVEDYSSWKGILTHLDLSDAKIVTDTVPYRVIDAKIINYWTNVKGKRYEFSKITKEEWETFCKDGGNDTRIYTIVPKDSTYLIIPKTNEDEIGFYMFENCDNLQQIFLPKDTRAIALRSFGDCRCLKEVTLPSGVQVFHANGLADCTSLETIKVCSGSPVLKQQEYINSGKMFGCHPNLRMVVDEALETYSQYHDRIFEENKKAMIANRSGKPSNVKFTPNPKAQGAPMGATVVSHYKMVNGKRVLVGREVKK